MQVVISRTLLFHVAPYVFQVGASGGILAALTLKKMVKSVIRRDKANFASRFFWIRLMPRLYSFAPYIVAVDTLRVVQRVARNDRRVITLKPEKPIQRNVLLSYINQPFFLKPGEPIPNSHTNFWESYQIAKTFLELGYQVDVISQNNRRFIPQKNYDFFVSTRHNLERLAPLLNKDCVKILHCDTADILFHDAAETRRVWELQQRKGVSLFPRRFEMPTQPLENADCAVCLGNEFTLNTYRYGRKPVYRLPISTPVLYPWPEGKDFNACRHHFLWFASGGLVHKGLDLVLDAFAEMPDYHLTICGPVQHEKEFEQVYYKELYQTPNIHTVGWVDIASPRFTEITRGCIGLIYPSCSEGQSGAVVTCLHAGLIPVVSYESGVDINDFGLILRSCSIEEIKNDIYQISSLPTPELERMACQAWEYARANHTKERFAEAYRQIILKIIADSAPARMSLACAA
jgi:glycosyltransferase involved in cell wall biosynthesis